MSTEPERSAWRRLHGAANAELAGRIRHTLERLEAEARGDAVELRRRPGAPGSGAWSSLEVLEHVALADRFLLILAGKIAARCEKRIGAGSPWPASPPDLERIAVLARDRSPWPHPEHMTPTGKRAPGEIARALAAQRERALALVEAMPAGEGTLHRVRMSRIPGDDRLELYQYLEVLARHAERHVAQIERNRRELAQVRRSP